MSNKSPSEKAGPAKALFFQRWGNAAQIASPLVAVLGFYLVSVQIDEARKKSTHEAVTSQLVEARKVYMSYSEASLRYPHLSEPDYQSLLKDKTEFVRYKNYIEHMLYAYDEMLNAVEDSDDPEGLKEWLIAFEVDMETHARYICQIPDPRFFAMFRSEMRERLDSFKEEGCSKAEPLKP